MSELEERRSRRRAAAAGVPFVKLDFDDGRIVGADPAAADAVPAALARYLAAVPLRRTVDTLVVAITDPDRAEIVPLLHAITGLEIERVVTTPSGLAAAQRRLYRPAPSGGRIAANGNGTNGRTTRMRRVAERPRPREPVVLHRSLERGISTLGFRLWVLPGIAFLIWGLFMLQAAVWEEGRIPGTRLEHVISWMGYGWAVPLLPALFALFGLMLFRKPPDRRTLEPIAILVSFRVVARGENAFRLRSTIESVRAELAALPLFPYVIEVVTDLPVDLGNGGDLLHYVVPADYRTGRTSLFKARALEYAVEVSKLPDDAWIMHLDEESHLTPSLVAGIREAVDEEERSGEHRIGQGAILYHRDLASRPFLTLADSIRTGDDLGRFFFQHRLGLTIFGLHGSFILVRNSVEKESGFDFGPEGSITEDSFWALRQMQHGRRCRWVDGYVAEQAPRTVLDFVKQRRRWFIGLAKVATNAPVGLRYRIPVALSTAVWSVSWIGILYLYVNLVTGFRVPAWVHVAGNVSFATYIATYVVGLRINLENLPPVGFLRAALLYVAQVVLIPVFALMEAAGVIYGFVRPEAGFHVIRK